MKVVIALVLATGVALFWLHHENQTLRSSFNRANQIATEQKITISRLDATLAAQRQLQAQNSQAEQIWRQQLADAEQHSVQREQRIARLLNENETFRRWYNAPLPDAVRGLHKRAACASASDCHPALSTGGAVPYARQRSSH